MCCVIGYLCSANEGNGNAYKILVGKYCVMTPEKRKMEPEKWPLLGYGIVPRHRTNSHTRSNKNPTRNRVLCVFCAVRVDADIIQL
jgi:hypothetical protein